MIVKRGWETAILTVHSIKRRILGRLDIHHTELRFRPERPLIFIHKIQRETF